MFGVVVWLDPGMWLGVGVGLHPGVVGCGARCWGGCMSTSWYVAWGWLAVGEMLGVDVGQHPVVATRAASLLENNQTRWP